MKPSVPDHDRQAEFGVEAAKHWKRVFWYVGVPLLGLTGYNAYKLETEEWKHFEEHPPRIYPYPHLQIFNKVHLLYKIQT
jgi:hypothetical protein